MKIRVLFFSVLQDIVGSPELEKVLSGDREWRVEDLLQLLYEDHEGLRRWDGKILIALDQAYADRSDILKDEQEVAIMPPVQGG